MVLWIDEINFYLIFYQKKKKDIETAKHSIGM